MNVILSFVSPLEFILRYTVIVGMVLAAIGCAIIFSARRITEAKRGVDMIDQNDKLYVALRVIGICLILVGIICIALPIEGTFYKF